MEDEAEELDEEGRDWLTPIDGISVSNQSTTSISISETSSLDGVTLDVCGSGGLTPTSYVPSSMASPSESKSNPKSLMSM